MATLGDGGASKLARLLTCRVGAKICALQLDHVVETFRPLPLERLTDLPPFVRGISMVRGRPTPVLDARTLLGSDDRQPPGRCVSLSWQARGARRAVALAVDTVLGVIELSGGRLDELPPLLRSSSGQALGAIGAVDSDLLLLLQHTRLLPEPLWGALETREVRA